MRLTQCCCGCSLRTGTLIIGYVHAIVGFITMVTCSIVTYMMSKRTPPDSEKNELTMIACGICSVVSLIQFIVSVSLIYGGYTGKRGFLLPWKIFAWINFVLVVVAVVLEFASLVMTGDPTVLFAVAVQTLSAAFLLYLIAVVNGYEDSLVQQTSVVYVANEDPGTNVNPVNNA